MKKIVLTLLCAVMAVTAARAETPLALSLEQWVDSAMNRNPAVAAAALQVEKSRILQGTAFDPPKTEITLKQETTGGGGPENGVYFGQEFEFPTTYVARRNTLAAGTRLEESRFSVLAADIEKEVSAAYHDLVYRRHLINLNDSLGKVYDEFCRLASIRQKEGEAGNLELMNAYRVKEQNAMERRTLETDYASRLSALKQLAGCVSDVDIAPVPLAPVEGLISADDMGFAATPRGIQADKAIDLADREIAEAKNEFLPGIKLGATVQALIKSFNPYNVDRERFTKGNFMGFEVGITVPLFFGAGSSRLKAANAEKRIAVLNREAEETRIKIETDRLKSVVAAAGSRLDYYRNTALPRAAEIKRIAQVEYDLGEISYMEYIQNIEGVFAVYREYADCLNDYNQAAIELKALYTAR